jgi:hypothetical protein
MLADLTPEQRAALIEAVTERTWVDGWERGITDEQREDAAYYFLAGWSASRGVKRAAATPAGEEG